MKELKKGNNTKIHAVNRAQMIDDAFNLARADRLNYTVALNLTLFLSRETDYVPWQPAFRHLSFLQNLLRTSDKYYTFRRYVAYLTRALSKHVGFEPKANDSDLVKALRKDAMRWACEAGVKNCTSYAEKTYQQWLRNPSTVLDVNLKNEILCAGVRTANESMWSNILKQITVSEPDEETRKEQLVALACSNSTKILKKYLNSTLSPGYPINFKTAAANVVSRYPGGAQLVFNFVLKEYRRIEKLENFKTIMKDVVTAISGGVTNKEQLLNLTAFFLGRKLDPEDDVLKDAVQNMIWINKYKSTVDEWLGDNSDIFERPDNG
ncbi:aminopeptidase N-like, partial [Ceratina calcarata]|uniref:Aminopeptidase N-like n=1 Tax=Ceratina calcarata TaxID=156304 RepID=A0AAJ7SBM8_9HYME